MKKPVRWDPREKNKRPNPLKYRKFANEPFNDEFKTYNKTNIYNKNNKFNRNNKKINASFNNKRKNKYYKGKRPYKPGSKIKQNKYKRPRITLKNILRQKNIAKIFRILKYTLKKKKAMYLKIKKKLLITKNIKSNVKKTKKLKSKQKKTKVKPKTVKAKKINLAFFNVGIKNIYKKPSTFIYLYGIKHRLGIEKSNGLTKLKYNLNKASKKRKKVKKQKIVEIYGIKKQQKTRTVILPTKEAYKTLLVHISGTKKQKKVKKHSKTKKLHLFIKKIDDTETNTPTIWGYLLRKTSKNKLQLLENRNKQNLTRIAKKILPRKRTKKLKKGILKTRTIAKAKKHLLNLRKSILNTRRKNIKKRAKVDQNKKLRLVRDFSWEYKKRNSYVRRVRIGKNIRFYHSRKFKRQEFFIHKSFGAYAYLNLGHHFIDFLINEKKYLRKRMRKNKSSLYRLYKVIYKKRNFNTAIKIKRKTKKNGIKKKLRLGTKILLPLKNKNYKLPEYTKRTQWRKFARRRRSFKKNKLNGLIKTRKSLRQQRKLNLENKKELLSRFRKYSTFAEKTEFMLHNAVKNYSFYKKQKSPIHILRKIKLVAADILPPSSEKNNKKTKFGTKEIKKVVIDKKEINKIKLNFNLRQKNKLSSNKKNKIKLKLKIIGNLRMGHNYSLLRKKLRRIRYQKGIKRMIIRKYQELTVKVKRLNTKVKLLLKKTQIKQKKPEMVVIKNTKKKKNKIKKYKKKKNKIEKSKNSMTFLQRGPVLNKFLRLKRLNKRNRRIINMLRNKPKFKPNKYHKRGVFKLNKTRNVISSKYLLTLLDTKKNKFGNDLTCWLRFPYFARFYKTGIYFIKSQERVFLYRKQTNRRTINKLKVIKNALKGYFKNYNKIPTKKNSLFYNKELFLKKIKEVVPKPRKKNKAKIRFSRFLRFIRVRNRHYTLRRKRSNTKMQRRIKRFRDYVVTPLILTPFLMSCKFEMGEKMIRHDQNLRIKDYMIYRRKKFAVYNFVFIAYGLRLTLTSILSRMLVKVRTIINYAGNDKVDKLYYKPIERFGQRNFLITWKKWTGGLLTNFKRISKRILLRMQNKNTGFDKRPIFVHYPESVPRIPGFMVAASNNHWVLNESKKTRIKSTQLIESSHLGYFGDISLAFNTSYFSLRSLTVLFVETICFSNTLNTLRHKFLKKPKKIQQQNTIFGKQAPHLFSAFFVFAEVNPGYVYFFVSLAFGCVFFALNLILFSRFERLKRLRPLFLGISEKFRIFFVKQAVSTAFLIFHIHDNLFTCYYCFFLGLHAYLRISILTNNNNNTLLFCIVPIIIINGLIRSFGTLGISFYKNYHYFGKLYMPSWVPSPED